MAVKKSAHALPDTYFALVKRFSLIQLRTDAQLSEAQEMIDELLAQVLDDGAEEYLHALTDLVETYEEEHVSIPDAPEADVLRELMSANGLSQMCLAKKSGISQSTNSAVLNGVRSLTKQQVQVLAKVFHISGIAFLKC